MTDARSRSVEDLLLLERVSRPSGARGGRAEEDVVDAEELERRLGLASRFLARRLLAALGAGADGTIRRAELVRRVEALIDGEPEAKLRFAFDVHDEDGDGRIDARELERMLWISLAENRLVFGPEVVDELAEAMMARADANRDGAISFEEFRGALESYPGVVEHMTLGDLRWLGLGPPLEGNRGAGREGGGGPRLRAMTGELATKVLVGAWALANVALFAHAFVRYGELGANGYVQVARGFGACLNLNTALVLVPMMRRLLTWVGRTSFGRVLVDDHVGFHRLVGQASFVFALGHTGAHVANWATSELGVVGGLLTSAGITGALALVLFAALYFFSRAEIRRSQRFELFHAVHRLWPLYFALLLLHGPVTWIWVAAPLAGYAIDRWLGRRAHATRIARAEVLPSHVTRLALARPAGFRESPGDYVFLRVPELAKLEWHPFTLSSAPEDEELSIHVRSVGNWTRALEARVAARRGGSGAEDGGDGGGSMEAFVDGPYGTPSAQIFRARRVVLVAGGIGVTPFASVLRSLLARRRRGETGGVERVHFVWICREQGAFAWFAELLGELEREAPELFDIQIFMDGGARDAKSTVLRIAMDLLYAETRSDLVTGLRARTTLGPPDFPELFAQIAREHAPDPVDAFFCGPEGLAKVVKRAARAAGMSFRQEHF